MNGLARVVSTVCWVGYVPFAPGTAGSVVGALVYWFLPDLSFHIYLVFLLFLFFVGVWGSNLAEGIFGHDASKVVIDEFVGFLVAMFALPKTRLILVLGFFLFRGLDIFKPFPLASPQRLRGGWGVMADDLLAGIYTNLLIRVGLLLKYWVV